MSEEKTDKNSVEEPFRNADDIDEELLNLSAPPPDLRLLLFTVIILTLSGVMIFWFVPEAKYLAAAFRDPQPLGEAADIDLKKLDNHTYVSIDGFPLIQRALTFKEGVKWFTLSDNTRKFFPLAGQPHLYVQWAETDEHKAYRDPETQPGTLGPPAHFEGHLVRRQDLGQNFDRIWVFYDCLKLHYLGRCNYCLGKTDMDQCRDAFVCAENNGDEACGKILERSEGPLDSEIAALEKSDGDQAQLTELRSIRAALREHRISVASVELEELATRARRLARLSAEGDDANSKKIQAARAEVQKLRVAELAVRATHASSTVKTLDKNERQEIRKGLEGLDALKAAIASQTKTLKILRSFVRTGEAIDRLISRIKAIRAAAGRLSLEELEGAPKWNPDTLKGEEILNAVSALESVLATRRQTEASKETASAGAQDPPAAEGDTEAKQDTASAEGDTEVKQDTAVETSPETAPIPVVEAPPEIQASPAYQTLLSTLDATSERAASLLKKLSQAGPGALPELDAWAEKPDVLGTVPEAVRERDVVISMHQLEKLLKGMDPSVETPPLIDRYNTAIDALDDLKKKVKAVEERPGAFEVGVHTRLAALEGAPLSPDMSREKADALDTQMDELIQYMTLHKLYLTELKGSPEEMARLEKILDNAVIAGLSRDLEAVSTRLESSDWVVIDREIPLDKLWVVLVYIVLGVMIFINIRKLRRFWRAYRD